jgi:hypothetical protein
LLLAKNALLELFRPILTADYADYRGFIICHSNPSRQRDTQYENRATKIGLCLVRIEGKYAVKYGFRGFII